MHAMMSRIHCLGERLKGTQEELVTAQKITTTVAKRKSAPLLKDRVGNNTDF